VVPLQRNQKNTRHYADQVPISLTKRHDQGSRRRLQVVLRREQVHRHLRFRGAVRPDRRPQQRLQKGETVQLGDLGHFQAVIGSKGTKLESDFNASLIKRPRIVFRPSVTLKSVTSLVKFEKIVPDAPAPGGSDSESPDEI
ncbi:LOW QUALITY PROTEIN: putative DNA-binding protein, partial [Bacteroides sp. 2_1_33B]